jgi:branched-chain amino acid transport system permease protein
MTTMTTPDIHLSSRRGVPKLFGTPAKKIFVALFVVAIIIIPTNTADAYVLTIFNTAAIAAIAATGLNLLTGYAGQISLGHAFFVGVGAFSAQYFGGTLGLPFLLWLPISAVLAGLVGAMIAPFALRLKGPYFAIVTLALVFIGLYIARNIPDITGGFNGTVVTAPVAIGPIDFAKLQVGPLVFTREQSLFLLFYTLLGVVLLLVANIVRSRSGRAMQAVRDHDLAAEVLGVNMFRTLTNAFVTSALIAGMAGGLLAVNLQYIRPENFSLELSIQYLAMIVIGGLASIWGPVLGALFVGFIPVITEYLASFLPFIASAGETTGLSSSDLSLIIYGVLIVVFLLKRRDGLIGFFRRRKN